MTDAIRGGRDVALDICRGLAALAVCAGHLRAAMFVDYEAGSSALAKLFYMLTSFGHQAVMVFFVLSGYLVGGSVLKAGRGFVGANYALARLTRLWTVLLPALVFTLVSDLILRTVRPEVFSGAYQALWSSGPARGTYDSGWTAFLGNVFFLQTVLVPVFGSNGPLWSLANEFFYYAIFPLMLISVGLVGSEVSAVRRSLAGLAALGLLALLPAGITAGFSLFVAGALVSSAHRHGWLAPLAASRTILVVSLLLFMLALGASKLGSIATWADFLVGFAFAGLLFCVGGTAIGGSTRRVAVFFSDISYSLYLSHFPLVLLIAATSIGPAQFSFSLATLAIYAGWMTMLIAVGWLFWLLFERHTERLRTVAGVWLDRWCRIRSPSSSTARS